MPDDLAIPSPAGALATRSGGFLLPAAIADQGDKAAERFFTFFTDTIPNANTRAAYYRNALRFFAWTDRQGLSLLAIKSYHVSAYLAELTLTGKEQPASTPTVKQHLASLRMLFDWLILGQVIDANPAAAVRAAKHVVKKGKTPVLNADEARQLLDSIPLKRGPAPEPGQEDKRPPYLIGLRDRALIAVMVYSFARVSAALGMKVEDYYTEGRRAWFRLHEKGGKRHEVPAHHNAEQYVDAYLDAAGIGAERKTPLFRTIDRRRQLTARPMHRVDAWRMIKQRAKAIGLPEAICNHTFRATGITAYLENGGTIEHAQQIANHESPKTTKLYDRTSDQITLDEVERIVI
jgi:site-specific recombinase XerD